MCGAISTYYPGPYFVNHYGLTKWSDGETFETLPSFKKSKLQKCDDCNQFYWHTRTGGGMSLEDYLAASEYFQQKFSVPSISNYILARCNKKRLLYIRLEILRQLNDSIRVHPLRRENDLSLIRDKLNGATRADSLASDIGDGRRMTDEQREIFIENARLMLPLLKDVEPHNHLLISELHRNLGDFQMAQVEILKHQNVAERYLILKEIEKENPYVITLRRP
jgi:hypothetical protein